MKQNPAVKYKISRKINIDCMHFSLIAEGRRILDERQDDVRHQQTGVAMVMVLWMVSLLTIMAGSFSLSTQRNTGLVNNAKERARGLALAEAGVNYALIMLSLPDPVKRWRSDGTYYQVVLPGGEAGITIFDESGKIDINSASEQTLRSVLGKLTGNVDQAASLTDIILIGATVTT